MDICAQGGLSYTYDVINAVEMKGEKREKS